MSYSHGSTVKRSRRVTMFHIVVWILSVVLAVFSVVMTQNLKALYILPVGALVGLPIKDELTWHQLIAKKWRSRRLRHHYGGVIRAAPLRRDPNEPPGSNIEQVRLALAAVQETGQSISALPFFTDPDGTHLTLVLYLGGASDEWVASSDKGRFFKEQDLAREVEDALSATNERHLDFVQGIVHRPADVEPMYRYSQSRLQADVSDAAYAADQGDTEGHSDVDVRVGTHAHARTETIYNRAEMTVHYCALRMEWPRTKIFKRRVDITDAKAFEKTNLWKTIRELLEAYHAMGITAEFNSTGELAEFFALGHNLARLRTLRYQWQCDRDLAELLGEPDNAQDLPIPLTINSDTDGSGWIEVDGTFIAAYYAESIRRSHLPAGFQSKLVQIPTGISYNAATWNDMPRIREEELRATGKEIGTKAFANQIPMDHISDPKGMKRVDDIVEQRARLAETHGRRSSRTHHLFIVLAESPEELAAKCGDAELRIGRIYNLVRVRDPEDIVDVVLAQQGVKIDD